MDAFWRLIHTMKKDKKNSFNTPEGYFESFNERLMSRLGQDETDASESIIPKTDGFGVPVGYFETIGPTILSKTTTEKGKVIPLRAYRKFYYGAAAVAAVLIIVFGLNWNAKTNPVTFDDLANTEIDAYFEANASELTSYDLAEVVALEDIQLNDMLEEDLNSEHILEYLDENVEDVRDLNLEEIDYE